MMLGNREALAQRVRPILVLTPQPATPADSAYARELGSAVRERLASKLGRSSPVLQTEDINGMLGAAGFEPNTILGPEDGRLLARALGAVPFFGTLSREAGAPVVRWHMVDESRSGWSGWVTIAGTAGDEAKRFAQGIVDTLEDHADAAEEARRCYQYEAEHEFKKARERAARALARYPGHPSAALCAYQVFLQTNAPSDSLIWALEAAVLGDSLLEPTWLKLADLYEEAGDQPKANEIRARAQPGGVIPEGLRRIAAPPSSGADTSELYEATALLQPPERISSPPVMYPRLLMEAGVEGEVTLEFVIGIDGRVEPGSINVISSPNRAFNKPARTVIQGSEFRPGRIDGKAVRTLVRQSIGFYQNRQS
jgi:TonB family protein